MKEMKVRDSNIELLRILMMIVIVAHHYIVNSGIFQVIVNTTPPVRLQVNSEQCLRFCSAGVEKRR